MKLYLNNEYPELRISRTYLERNIKKILKHLHLSHSILGVTFVTNDQMAHLNWFYLKKKGPTDVLSFPLGEINLLGDLVIAPEVAKKQAKQKKISLRDQYLFLMIHGLLHLLGYDHLRWKDYLVMKAKEEELWEVVYK